TLIRSLAICLLTLIYCSLLLAPFILCFFFFTDTATTEIYTLSLHDALPISIFPPARLSAGPSARPEVLTLLRSPRRSVKTSGLADRKSTRLNSSHDQISYAVFCLKKKKKNYKN